MPFPDPRISICRDEVRFESSADEILGEPDDQVIIDGDPHPFAERLLTPACAPAVGDIVAPRNGPATAIW
jgi:hypothetical protein